MVATQVLGDQENLADVVAVVLDLADDGLDDDLGFVADADGAS